MTKDKEEASMRHIIKMSELSDFALTREAGNRIYEKIKESVSELNLSAQAGQNIDSLIVDFENIEDVSVSFIQATVFRLAKEFKRVELKNINNAIRFKIDTLLKITTIDPAILNKIKNYRPKSF